MVDSRGSRQLLVQTEPTRRNTEVDDTIERSYLKNSYISEHIRRASKTSLVYVGLAFAFMFFLLAINWRYLNNAIHGPFQLSEQEFASIDKPKNAQRYFVQINAAKPLDTGLHIDSEKSDGETKSDRFFLLPVGQHFVLFKSQEPPETVACIGELTKTTEEESTLVVAPLLANNPELANGRLYPYTLVEKSTFVFGFMSNIILFTCGLMTIVSLVLAYRAAMGFAKPMNHKIVSRLKVYGSPIELMDEIEKQILDVDSKPFGKTLLITKDWLLIPTALDLIFVRTRDIVWVYHKDVVHAQSIAGIKIPYFLTFEVLIYVSSHDWYTVSGPKKILDRFIEALPKHCPWVFIGWRDDQVWAEMVEVAAERYQKIRG
ncbi:MAG: DUF6709 family protein [Candidatus Melainabacteria bacterium]|nr:DUF6709 family protein [Candidatus Melainabacteria bacterium]